LNAPIVLFAYNRLKHTKQTVEALAANRGAKDFELFVFCDGAKGERDKAGVMQVKEYIKQISLESCFRAVHFSFSRENKGCANSIIAGVSSVLESYDKVIVVEDDIVTTSGFLEYMNDALRFFEEHKKIWSISGYALPINLPENYQHDLYLTPRSCSWGWGTWRDRWSKVDWEVKDYQGFRKNPWRRMAFNRGGLDLSSMLDAQMTGKIDAWDIIFCFTQYMEGSLTVYPRKSFVQNIGLDGTGTHSGFNPRYQVVAVDGEKKVLFELPPENPVILRRFRNYYLHPVRFTLSAIKQFVLRILRGAFLSKPL